MQIVVIHAWQPQQESEIARVVAELLGLVAFEARQKITGGGPMVLASFAAPQEAQALVRSLTERGVAALQLDPAQIRASTPRVHARRFTFRPQLLELETRDGRVDPLPYRSIEFMLGATRVAGTTQSTQIETKRKFSAGRTLLAGGLPMSKQVKRRKTVVEEERDETLWLFASGQPLTIFDRSALCYDGLGDALQMTRRLNFAHLKQELRVRAPGARLDDRLLRRAAVVHLLGSSFSPETELDLALWILARSLSSAD